MSEAEEILKGIIKRCEHVDLGGLDEGRYTVDLTPEAWLLAKHTHLSFDEALFHVRWIHESSQREELRKFNELPKVEIEPNQPPLFHLHASWRSEQVINAP